MVKKGVSMMKTKDIFEVSGNALMYVLTATQTKEVFEIISLVLSILISVLIIVGKLVSWFKKANADGKITKEEIDEGIEILEDAKDKMKGDNHK